jgi:hypothetical protein
MRILSERRNQPIRFIELEPGAVSLFDFAEGVPSGANLTYV